MAANKKTKKKSKDQKRSARKKSTPKKSAKSKPATKSAKKKSTKKKVISGKKRTRKESQRLGAVAFSRKDRSLSGEQSGDLQGLSRFEGADSESVDELLEEGNAFEAEVVSGVEDADTADGRGVRTHEVPEDDVPGEYLDKD